MRIPMILIASSLFCIAALAESPAPKAVPVDVPKPTAFGATEAQRVVDKLVASGLSLSPIEEQPISDESEMSHKAQQCTVGGVVRVWRGSQGMLAINAFASAHEAEAAAQKVGCSGDVVNGCILEYNSSPRWFRQGNLLIEHLGGDKAPDAVTRVLGAPFAGRDSPCHAIAAAHHARAEQQRKDGDVGGMRGQLQLARGQKYNAVVATFEAPGVYESVQNNGVVPIVVDALPSGSYTVTVHEYSGPQRRWIKQGVVVKKGKVTDLGKIAFSDKL